MSNELGERAARSGALTEEGMLLTNHDQYLALQEKLRSEIAQIEALRLSPLLAGARREELLCDLAVTWSALAGAVAAGAARRWTRPEHLELNVHLARGDEAGSTRELVLADVELYRYIATVAKQPIFQLAINTIHACIAQAAALFDVSRGTRVHLRRRRDELGRVLVEGDVEHSSRLAQAHVALYAPSQTLASMLLESTAPEQ